MERKEETEDTMYMDGHTVDTENCQILLDMKQKFDEMKPKPLFNHQRILEAYETKHENQCKIETCTFLKQMVNTMKAYRQYINNNQNKNKRININDVHKDIQDDVKLLNSYHHLLSEHDNQFEEIHTILTKENDNHQCPISSCYMMQRNHRDRSSLSRNDHQIKLLYFDNNREDIAKQQFLDTMHCHYFHSFDTGYRISKEQQAIMLREIKSLNNCDDNKEYNIYARNTAIEKISEFITLQKDSLRNIDGLRRLRQNNDKFTTIVADNDEKNDNTKPFYRFGYRYFYWDYYKNNENAVDVAIRPNKGDAINFADNRGYTLSDWYIAPLFKSLKDELLNNSISAINQTQWNIHGRKAQIFMKTDKLNNKRCSQICFQPRNETRLLSKKIYGILHDELISCSHITVILIYCNETDLQNRFSGTFRRIPYNESDDSLKKRHSNYHHCGRLLRELVECFGFKYDSSKSHPFWAGHLFHGISIEAQFRSVHTRINGPVSTTTDYAVAANFCGNTGLIVEFVLNTSWCYGLDNDDHVFWDCHWLSDFTNEQERFLIGGFGTFVLKTIIIASIGYDFKHYINAMTQITMPLTGNPRAMQPLNRPKTEEQKIIVFRLLLHKLYLHYPDHKSYHSFKLCPKYVESLWINHCNDVQIVSLHDVVMDRCNYRKQLFQSLFFYDNGWLKLDILTVTFPNVEYVMLDYDKKGENRAMLQSESLYTSLLEFVSKTKNVKNQLKRIEIWFYVDDSVATFVNTKINEFSKKFVKFGWEITCRDKTTKTYNGNKKQKILSIAI